MGQYASYIQLGTSLLGPVLGAVGSVNQGQAASQSGKYEARQLRRQASGVEGAATRSAMEQERRARILQSKLIARAAASGGSATDPTVLTLEGDIAQEGRYRALVDLYEGYSEGAQLRSGANIAEYEGKQKKTAGFIGAGSSLLSGAGSLFSNYGGGGLGYNPLSEGETFAYNQSIGR